MTDPGNRMRQHRHAELLLTEEYQDKKDTAKKEHEIKGWVNLQQRQTCEFALIDFKYLIRNVRESISSLHIPASVQKVHFSLRNAPQFFVHLQNAHQSTPSLYWKYQPNFSF